jgi:hypothetical protein
MRMACPTQWRLPERVLIVRNGTALRIAYQKTLVSKHITFSVAYDLFHQQITFKEILCNRAVMDNGFTSSFCMDVRDRTRGGLFRCSDLAFMPDKYNADCRHCTCS